MKGKIINLCARIARPTQEIITIFIQGFGSNKLAIRHKGLSDMDEIIQNKCFTLLQKAKKNNPKEFMKSIVMIWNPLIPKITPVIMKPKT